MLDAASAEGGRSDKVYKSADATVSCHSHIWKHFDSLMSTKRKGVNVTVTKNNVWTWPG